MQLAGRSLGKSEGSVRLIGSMTLFVFLCLWGFRLSVEGLGLRVLGWGLGDIP